MELVNTSLPEVMLLKPKVHGDHRGFFMETFRKEIFENAGIAAEFVQDNHSKSARGILRGLHYQIKQPQGKLIRVVAGEIFDVAVDMRRSSPTFGLWVGVVLSAENKQALWVPPGFAHGFYVMSAEAEVVYKATTYYAPEHERSLLWNDPLLNISWPEKTDVVLSDKDKNAPMFAVADAFP
ncbi:MAG: dTDP-4-dehydrorhamnose 3,5-epimerase [Pseudomonadota bacterium]